MQIRRKATSDNKWEFQIIRIVSELFIVGFWNAELIYNWLTKEVDYGNKMTGHVRNIFVLSEIVISRTAYSIDYYYVCHITAVFIT